MPKVRKSPKMLSFVAGWLISKVGKAINFTMIRLKATNKPKL